VFAWYYPLCLNVMVELSAVRTIPSYGPRIMTLTSFVSPTSRSEPRFRLALQMRACILVRHARDCPEEPRDVVLPDLRFSASAESTPMVLSQLQSPASSHGARATSQ
jgi:hypothetical protein